jgi:hypothetical protein
MWIEYASTMRRYVPSWDRALSIQEQSRRLGGAFNMFKNLDEGFPVQIDIRAVMKMITMNVFGQRARSRAIGC